MAIAAPPSRVYFASPERRRAAALLREAAGEVASRLWLVRHLSAAIRSRAGANTLLGNVWWVLDPVLQMPLYVLLVGVILRSGTQAYPLFVFSAVLSWKWFTAAMIDATLSISSRDRLIKELPFPKIILPVATIVSGIPQFAFGLVPLFALMAGFYRDRFSAWLILLPLVGAVQFVFTLAVGVALAAFNVFARDTGRLSGHVLRLWFFLSPALYATDRIDHVAARYPLVGVAFRLNPFTTLFESYRDLIYHARPPDVVALAWLLLASAALLALTTVVFKRLEPSFAKVL